MGDRYVWKPQPRQAMFQARREYEALYGGAAGGGKSEALVMEALRQAHLPHYRGLILRKTYPQLTDLIDKSQKYYRRAFPKAKYNSTEHFWRFPSGAKIYFGSMQHEKDRHNYQGLSFEFVGFDELTHFSWDEYAYLMSRNRPNGEGGRVYIRATTNPGGNGHGWVKDRFITAAPPLTTIEDAYRVVEPGGAERTITRSRVFVPASVFDNPILLQNDPMYLGNLAMLPEADRNALLYGSWDSFDGQVFREWVNDPAHYDDRRMTHVIAPFRIPKHWRVYRGLDWGYAKPFSVGWYAADPDGRIFRIAEYYGCRGTPNQGVEMEAVEVAANIRRIEGEDDNLRGRKIAGIADPAIFQSNGGQNTADLMAKPPNSVYFQPGDHARLSGKMQMHYRLAFGRDGIPMLQIFNTCAHFIRTIPALVYDDKHVEDVDTSREDHAYDECRYVLMANPISPRAAVLEKPVRDDPLDLYRDTRRGKQDPYKYYRV